MTESAPEATATLSRRVAGVLPGLVLLSAGAVLARVAAPAVPGLNALLVAVVVGVLLANAVGVPAVARPGVETHSVALEAAIVLLGASVSLGSIVASGAAVVLTVLGATALSLALVELCARRLFGVDGQLASLLAAGASICGVSAIVAVAGSIRAREEHVVYAAATILLFDAVTLVVYPVVGRLLSLPDTVFGVWAGVSMFSTGPVAAAGFAYSETAGQWATMTKLTRNALIGVLAVAYATHYARQRLDDADGVRLRELWERFPTFVLGFVALLALASAGAFTGDQLALIGRATDWLFLVAFVGLGTELRLGKLRQAGMRPVAVVLLSLCVVSALSLAAAWVAVG